MSEQKVHVVVGLYGMLLTELDVLTDKEKALERGKELAREYDCYEEGGKISETEQAFYGIDSQRENEVHVWFDLELDKIYKD